ncbi:hypothetical protein NIES2135_20970 [Leptolyngbya boryana NIES-2135]|jgi:hypothetical protein|uniref:Uncharacterized protein n=1 Tax=Leptolyngbya boryana NIES-2135 TaxID=1973484 RepID=A0A1Z4JES1_LEPBY|nr:MULTISPECIES: hypothetical protein [Leptolyngbya]BAY55274.1 hypothetical protein NIES2135_20970 [Leptolyngbya boryana NIES-2135]MBD2369358.1 hypothetical protein [Leptolyngbya sp. FACHB-161]MBD2375640.1 hypothetical protein [Leptolyngbya sp. FACHB-238]MBD2401687.1 hypothetical protein [Leptolyngbya sp. FACHB-239]MBD2406574.1 hypothetical protein [Leptolyngbya sp. FACHB-402]
MALPTPEQIEQVHKQLGNLSVNDIGALVSLSIQALVEMQSAIEQGGSPGGGGGSTETTYTQIMNANDLGIVYVYADAGTADERLTEITYSSTTVGSSISETITYAGASGSYRPVSRSRSIAGIPE